MRNRGNVNPFAITKAVDLNDEQIERLWVRTAGKDDPGPLQELDHPITPMPTFILGAKGSGKTHLMRHQAYELQKLRYEKAGRSSREGISDDGYIGLYVRCSGLQSSRFSGKRQPDELWQELFSYYFELWLAQHMLYVVSDLKLGQPEEDEHLLVGELLNLFDQAPIIAQRTVKDLTNSLSQAQKKLDFEINNCLLTGSIDVQITATRGKLIFGIPHILAQRYAFLREVLFSYDIDEFENLTESQQIHINTLVREKEQPTTFRIGSRTYGVRTHMTNSGGEENLTDSEYQEIHLDYEFRTHKKAYSEFARAIIWKRLAAGSGRKRDQDAAGFLDQYFEHFDKSWLSKDWLKRLEPMREKTGIDRPHFARLHEILGTLKQEAAFENAVEMLRADEHPLIEKLNILLLYQDLSRQREIAEAINDISDRARRFLAEDDTPQSSYRTSLQHYGDDLAAQLLRENRSKQIYSGIDTFIQLSAGIPRALLTVLRSTFEWAVFRDETPFDGGIISLESQIRGVIEASNWYFNNMRKAGEEGFAIQGAVERLSNIFRINRFSDKPIEVALTTFSVSEQEMSTEARTVLKLAEARSFLHRIPSGQRERNSEKITSKYQLSPMLSPRSDLGITRRGTLPLRPGEANAIFEPNLKEEYEKFEKSFRARVSLNLSEKKKEDGNQIGLFS